MVYGRAGNELNVTPTEMMLWLARSVINAGNGRGSFIRPEGVPSFYEELPRCEDVPPDVPADFKCSKCNAHYKVVRVKAESQSLDRPLHCKVCNQPLAARDGEDVLKYFLLDRPRTRRAS
jgi:DNA-directed RNA polymerase subunit RPC12/RpoP